MPNLCILHGAGCLPVNKCPWYQSTTQEMIRYHPSAQGDSPCPLFLTNSSSIRQSSTSWIVRNLTFHNTAFSRTKKAPQERGRSLCIHHKQHSAGCLPVDSAWLLNLRIVTIAMETMSDAPPHRGIHYAGSFLQDFHQSDNSPSTELWVI